MFAAQQCAAPAAHNKSVQTLDVSYNRLINEFQIPTEQECSFAKLARSISLSQQFVAFGKLQMRRVFNWRLRNRARICFEAG